MNRGIIAFILMLILTTLISCSSNTYESGVAYDEFPDSQIPIYDDAIVYNFFGDDESCGIEYGSDANVNKIIEFYQEEFSDSKYTILHEEEKNDMYEFEGYIDDISFDIDIEKAQGSKADYYSTVANISVEEFDNAKIEVIEVVENDVPEPTVQEVADLELQDPTSDLPPVIEPSNIDSQWNFSTSSFLIPNNPSNGPYDASQICDDSLATCWIPGNNRSGINEQITINLENGRMSEVDHLLIFGGYGKSKQAYYCNLRLKQITIQVDGSYVGVYILQDIQEYQKIELPEEIIGKTITIRIDDYYQSTSYEGHKAWNDLCISEIKVYGKVIE
jgi:hypothetical protein